MDETDLRIIACFVILLVGIVGGILVGLYLTRGG